MLGVEQKRLNFASGVCISDHWFLVLLLWVGVCVTGQGAVGAVVAGGLSGKKALAAAGIGTHTDTERLIPA